MATLLIIAILGVFVEKCNVAIRCILDKNVIKKCVHEKRKNLSTKNNNPTQACNSWYNGYTLMTKIKSILQKKEIYVTQITLLFLIYYSKDQ